MLLSTLIVRIAGRSTAITPAHPPRNEASAGPKSVTRLYTDRRRQVARAQHDTVRMLRCGEVLVGVSLIGDVGAQG